MTMFDALKKGINNLFKKVEKSITETTLTQKEFDKFFWELELELLQSNVSADVVDKMKEELEKELVGKSVNKNIKKVLLESLKQAISSVLYETKIQEFLSKIRSKKPFVIMFVGVNGSGKTTTIAKLAHLLKSKGFSVVLAAGDTFRAASIEQLKHHAEKVGVDIIYHDYGSDAAAVGFDAIRFAEKNGKDVVLIDTAGRLHSNKNLMDELKKIKRVDKPDITIFVADAITGSDVVNQAKIFNDELGIDYVILTKTDVDNKGGAILSVSYTIKKPILFLANGQSYKDLKPFKKEEMINKIIY